MRLLSAFRVQSELLFRAKIFRIWFNDADILVLNPLSVVFELTNGRALDRRLCNRLLCLGCLARLRVFFCCVFLFKSLDEEVKAALPSNRRHCLLLFAFIACLLFNQLLAWLRLALRFALRPNGCQALRVSNHVKQINLWTKTSCWRVLNALLALFSELNQVSLMLERVQPTAEHWCCKFVRLVVSSNQFECLGTEANTLFLFFLFLRHLKFEFNSVLVLLLFILDP